MRRISEDIKKVLHISSAVATLTNQIHASSFHDVKLKMKTTYTITNMNKKKLYETLFVATKFEDLFNLLLLNTL